MYVITKLVHKNRYFFNAKETRWEGLIDNATFFTSFPYMDLVFQTFLLANDGATYEYIQPGKKRA